MRASPCLRLSLSDDERVALLLEDYDFFVRDRALFCDRLAALTELRGKAVVKDWQAKVAAGEFDAVVRDLLARHYDPGYLSSMRRSFQHYDASKLIAAQDRSMGAMVSLASQIMEETR